MKKNVTEIKIKIPIVDDAEWEPDLDFFVELFDPNQINEQGNPAIFQGEDTKCKITILDEDFPGTLGFEIGEKTVNVTKDKEVEITILRHEGADGTISCSVHTEPMCNTDQGEIKNNAVEFEDYIPLHDKVTFGHGETSKTVRIGIISKESNKKLADDKVTANDVHPDDEDSEGDPDVLFRVMMDSPEPMGVKISKKN
jgi:hypothetical protein